MFTVGGWTNTNHFSEHSSRWSLFLGLDWAPHTALYSALTALGPTCIREIISCQATFASRIHRISTVTPQSINQNKWCAYTYVYNLSTVCQSGAKNQQKFMFFLFWDVSPNLFWAKQNANKMQYVIALIAKSHQITIIFHQPVFPWNMLGSSCYSVPFGEKSDAFDCRSMFHSIGRCVSISFLTNLERQQEPTLH